MLPRRPSRTAISRTAYAVSALKMGSEPFRSRIRIHQTISKTSKAIQESAQWISGHIVLLE